MTDNKNNQLDALMQGKNISMPVDVVIDNKPYVCIEILRLLPKKRLVIKVQDDKNEKQAIKLFAKQKKGRREFAREQKGYQLATQVRVHIPQLMAVSSSLAGYYAIFYQYLEDSKRFTDDILAMYADKLLAMVIALHSAGLYQADFHLDNILIVDDKLYLIDLASIWKRGASLDKRCSLANLAMLVVQFKPREQAILIGRLQKYYQARGWQFTANDKHQFNGYVQKAWNKRKANYLNKQFRACSMTAYQQTYWQEYGFRRAFFNEVGAAFIDNIDHFFSAGKILKAGNSATVIAVDYANTKLVIKRYNIKGIWHFLSRCWRPSRAAVSWRNGHLLQLLGIATPNVIGFIEKRIGWLRTRAYLICEYKDGQSIAEAFQSRLPTIDEKQQLKDIFTLLKAHQISHGDLKATNLLIDKMGKIHLIDLDAMQQHTSRHSFLRAFNKDKSRFCQNWQTPILTKLFGDIVS